MEILTDLQNMALVAKVLMQPEVWFGIGSTGFFITAIFDLF